ncbi:MAG: hypothetical protein OXG58_04855 [Gemmatimonadetes bacterium]|nr:hypothetical protein [Gemmatimonadota bacterium]
MSVDSRRRDAHRRRTLGALRLASSVSVAVAVASWVAGCGDPQPPVAVGSMPELTVHVGSTESVDLAGYFSDEDGDVLAYSATTSDAGVATASVSGSAVMVSGVSQGIDTVTVTATDPGELSVVQTFTVTVPNRAPEAGEPIEDIEVFLGQEAQVDVSGNLSDPDGDALSYTATTSDAGVATASVSGSTVTVGGVTRGTTDVTVTVTVAFPAATAVTCAVAPDTLTVAMLVFDELAPYMSSSPSGSLKCAARSTGSVLPTSTVRSSIFSATGCCGSPHPTTEAATAARTETPRARRSAARTRWQRVSRWRELADMARLPLAGR